MKFSWGLIIDILALIICTAAIAGFVILAIAGENVLRWIPALFLSLFINFFAIKSIINRKNN